MDDSAATTPTTTTEIPRGQQQGKHNDNKNVVIPSKPLHRFVEKEPQSLGIVIVICGCAEVMMGFVLVSERRTNSTMLYIPFWQGALFLICGLLSIYTGARPSKRMVTVCLAMYVISILGIIVSFGYRISCFSYYRYVWLYAGPSEDEMWSDRRLHEIFGVESILFSCSLCVSVLLIFLSVVARLALKSTNTQVIFQRVPTQQ
uniref:membrane-spanning 4-domains subfamily A member 4D-like n=1 Tax=Doryrhamphus excisus TaxID=161450 RepID=UPI0025AE6C59|nr:membrane-spanning 4-domains subfamily A member 4D-like [Doryrhamphus excisus]